MAQQLPSGQVTFAFTDVVGSTRTFTEHGKAYAKALPAMHAVVAAATTAHGGAVVQTEGDGTFLAFPTATAAVRALIEMQQVLEREPPEGLWLRIRAGAHAGAAQPVDGEYLALAVYHAARVSSAAGAGQVLVSDTVIDDVDDAVLEEVAPVDVGAFELKDVREPMRLWRVAGDDSPPRAVPARRTNVAESHSSFVGRDDDLAAVTEMLARPGLVTLVGPGGVGKTRLVSELALRTAARTEAGIWLVELAPATTGEEVLQAVALTLGLSGSPSMDILAAELVRRGRVVLVLDNCEQVADAAADLVAELTHRHRTLSVLATSREPLDVLGERVHRVAPLAVSDPRSLVDGTRPGPAEELFVARAESAGGRFAAEDLSVVAQICDLLDGLPLAVELAAARASTLPPAALLQALREGHVELRRRGGVDRQRSLGSLVRWGLDLLDDPHRAALLALSVFPGRFTVDMAAPVLNALPRPLPVGALAELARRSLIDLDGTEYRMLVTIRGVVADELDSRPDLRTAAMEGVLAWATGRASEPSETRAEWSEPEIRAIEVALRWGLLAGTEGVGRLLEVIGAWSLGHTVSPLALQLCDEVLQRPAPDPGSIDEIRLVAAAVRLAGGYASRETISAERARDLITAARLHEVAHPAVVANVFHTLAAALARMGHFDEALPLLEHLADVATDEAERAYATMELGSRGTCVAISRPPCGATAKHYDCSRPGRTSTGPS